MPMRIGTHEHHLLAALLAQREYSDEEASAISGYSPVTVCNMRQQKPFQELVDYYKGNHKPVENPDPGARMHALGLSTLQELQHRLATDPDGWTKHELLVMAELQLIKAQSLGPRGTTSGSNGENKLNLAISFVPARKVPELEGPVLEADPVTNGHGTVRAG